jgi:hypothetical protein
MASLRWLETCHGLVGSLIFGAQPHRPPRICYLGSHGGGRSIWFALRLRYDSLSPAWLSHFLFNAEPFLIVPLITWLAPAFGMSILCPQARALRSSGTALRRPPIAVSHVRYGVRSTRCFIIFRLQRCDGFFDQALDRGAIVIWRIGPTNLYDHEVQ